MLIVGLTGGIATGKSTVSKYISEKHKVRIIDADVIAKQVVEPGTSGYKKVVAHFGPTCPDLLLEDGSLNRPALGRAVFGNETERKVLNGIIHPEVRYETLRQIFMSWITGHRMIILDVPLLFEAKMSSICGATIAVVCDEATEMERLLKRDQFLSKEDADKRVASQMSLDKKRELADIVIENDSGLEDLYGNVDRVVDQLMPSKVVSTVEWLVPPVGLIMALYTYLTRRSKPPVAKL